jgi:hypothetical protein
MKYTERELTEVARKMSLDRDLGDILRAARGHSRVPGSDGWRDEVLRSAATWAGRSGSMRQILNALEASAMKEETFTFAELEGHFQRMQLSRNVMGGAAQEARVVLKDIKDHREPEYPANTVVRDAEGAWYRRFLDGWGVFGRTGRVAFDVPKRPLTVKE